MKYFVTAIGTDSGKTVVSAILTEMLQADYWKPVQSGEPRDTETVQALLSNSQSKFYKEKYLLKTPASPHASAKIDGVEITIDSFIAPTSNRDLVIEGAGGLLVPLNEEQTMLDLIMHLDIEVVLVANLYLGSINHTLLTVEVLKQHGVNVKGIVFNGIPNKESERIILAKSGYAKLLNIVHEENVDSKMISKYSKELKKNWR